MHARPSVADSMERLEVLQIEHARGHSFRARFAKTERIDSYEADGSGAADAGTVAHRGCCTGERQFAGHTLIDACERGAGIEHEIVRPLTVDEHRHEQHRPAGTSKSEWRFASRAVCRRHHARRCAHVARAGEVQDQCRAERSGKLVKSRHDAQVRKCRSAAVMAPAMRSAVS